MVAHPQVQSKTLLESSLRRALFVSAFIVFWMLAISVRLLYLQVSMHDQLTERAHKQQQGSIETGFERGELMDREGRQLARSIATESVFVAPDEIVDTVCAGELLARALDLDSASLVRQLAAAKDDNRRFLWIARRMVPEQAAKVSE